MTAYKLDISIKDLLEAGVHYGHRKSWWNAKMAKYIYGVKEGLHIIDLSKTLPMMHRAMELLFKIASDNGRILFVCTKQQGSAYVAANAIRCGQYYVDKKWPGGLMTNLKTISASIKKANSYEKILNDEKSGLTKKEILRITKKRDKIMRSLGGIRDMGGMPDALFVIDVKTHEIAVKEANKVNVPVIGIVDTNSDPKGLKRVVPGNDDATKSIELYTRLAADAILMGMQEGMKRAGVDINNLKNTVEGKTVQESKAEQPKISEKNGR